MNSEAHDHIVKSYDAELQRLAGEIAGMGELAISQLHDGMQALLTHDGQLAKHVIDGDDVLDAWEREISHGVLRLLALRQPAARDLREVLATLRIASDIERMGDYAVNIAKHLLSLEQAVPEPFAGKLTALAQLAVAMFRDVLLAWCERDATLAHAVWGRDDEVDAGYAALCQDLMTGKAGADPDIAERTHLLFVAKNLERVGDHATNIAENVWFLVDGEPATRGDGPSGSLTKS